MARRHLMDFDDFDDGGGLGDALGEIVTPEQLKGLLLSGLVGGGGILGVGYLTRMIPLSGTWRSVIGALAGLIGGRLIWTLDEDAARGFAGGVTGMGIASLISALAPSVQVGFSGLGYNPQYGWGIGQPGTRYMDYGMGRTRVDAEPAGAPPLAATFGRTRIESKGEDEFSLGSSFGLGQDVAVGAWLT
jgi:hypothetical protein